LQNSKSLPIYDMFKADSTFSTRISDTFYEEIYLEYRNNLEYHNPQKYEMALRFVINGCAYTIRYWIMSDMKQPVHQIATFICNISDSALK